MIKLQIKLKPKAEADLADIYHYTRSQWGKNKAVHYIHALSQRLVFSAENPFSGSERSDLAEGLRCITGQSHLIFYRIIDDSLIVIRVLHQSSDYLNTIRA